MTDREAHYRAILADLAPNFKVLAPKPMPFEGFDLDLVTTRESVNAVTNHLADWFNGSGGYGVWWCEHVPGVRNVFGVCREGYILEVDLAWAPHNSGAVIATYDSISSLGLLRDGLPVNDARNVYAALGYLGSEKGRVPARKCAAVGRERIALVCTGPAPIRGWQARLIIAMGRETRGSRIAGLLLQSTLAIRGLFCSRNGIRWLLFKLRERAGGPCQIHAHDALRSQDPAAAVQILMGHQSQLPPRTK